MDFLESLYEIPNFGIYLFVVIGILVVIFLVILFFGKKDAQKRKAEKESISETVPIPIESNDESVEKDVWKEISEPTPLEIPMPVEEAKPVMSVEPPIATTNVVLNSDFMEDVKPIESQPVVPEVPSFEPQEKEFDFDALASAISKELESIESVGKEEEKKLEEPILAKEEEPSLKYQVFEPVSAEPQVDATVVSNTENIEKPKDEVKVKPVMPKVFSSVYVNRDKEEPILSENQKIEEPEIMKPVVPKIELPKMMDLPKKNNSVDDSVFH